MISNYEEVKDYMIVITGSTGFVGQGIVKRVIEASLPVRVVLRPSSKVVSFPNGSIEQVTADPMDSESLVSAVEGAHYIVHCAGALAGQSYDDYYRGNVMYTQNLISAVKKAGAPIKKFILISSQAAAGPAGVGEVKTEESPENPISLYGLSKQQAEEVLRASGLPYVILRPAPIYGPRDKEFLSLFKMAKAGLFFTVGDGEQVINLVHIDDLIESILQVLTMQEGVNKTYFVTGNGQFTQNEILDFCRVAAQRNAWVIHLPILLARLIGVLAVQWGRITGKVPLLNLDKIREMEQRTWLCSGAAIREDLGFIPQREVQEGFQQTFQWYRDIGWL
jgi:nucleoside-diphosphate-sugar epimerase